MSKSIQTIEALRQEAQHILDDLKMKYPEDSGLHLMIIRESEHLWNLEGQLGIGSHEIKSS